MALNAHIVKKDGENTMSALKRFTQAVRSAGVVNKLKSRKFDQRKMSSLKTKEAALRKISRQAEQEFLRKMGKIK